MAISAAAPVVGTASPLAQAASSFGDRARLQAAATPDSAFPGDGRQRTELAEIASLKKEVARPQAERDILKKVAAFLAREAT